LILNHFNGKFNGYFKEIEKWCNDPTNVKHPIYMQRKKAKFKGLCFNTPQQKVFDTLQVTTNDNFKQYMKTSPIINQPQVLDDKTRTQMINDKTTTVQLLLKTLQDTEYTFEQKLSKIAKQIKDFNDAMVNKQEQLHSQILNTNEKETKVFQNNIQNIYNTMTKEAKQKETRLSGDIILHVKQRIHFAYSFLT
jgi:hypothetical protein